MSTFFILINAKIATFTFLYFLEKISNEKSD